MTKTSTITQSFLHSILNYDPYTGIFTWNVFRGGTAKPGTIAGTIEDGYRRIIVNGKSYRAHRLAWFYIYGVWPPEGTDHYNRIRDDNRLCNIRTANDEMNSRNKGKYKNNKSGYKGVSWKDKNNKWVAQIQVNKKGIHLGLFDTA